MNQHKIGFGDKIKITGTSFYDGDYLRWLQCAQSLSMPKISTFALIPFTEYYPFWLDRLIENKTNWMHKI